MSNLKNRIGTIEISNQLIEMADKNIMKAFFSEFYPVAIKEHKDSFYYLCISEHFEKVKKSNPIPRYNVSFTFSASGKGKLTNVEKL